MIRIEPVPFVQRNNQCPSLPEDMREQGGVLVGQTLPGVEHQDHDMGTFDGLQGLYRAELLHRLGDAPAPPDAGRIDQLIGLTIPLDAHADRVPGRPRLVEGKHAFLAENSVDQRRFAHVGPSDDSQAHDALFRCTLRYSAFNAPGKCREGVCRLQHQVVETLPVLGRDHQGIAHSQTHEVQHCACRFQSLRLVRQQQ